MGLDVGGTGLKIAIVDTNTGEMVSEKLKCGTPQPSTPENVIVAINDLLEKLNWKGKPFGCGMPSVIKNNICYTAANIDKGWKNLDLGKFFKDQTNCDVIFGNDADLAGIAEMKFGTGIDKEGTVVVLTLGTGIGSGVFLDGKLLPNTEFGHLLYKRSVFEKYASNGARLRKKMSWKKWASELNCYLNHIELIVSPDLIILGGGVSKEFEMYKSYLNLRTEVVPAKLENSAGLIGAAMLAAEHFNNQL